MFCSEAEQTAIMYRSTTIVLAGMIVDNEEIMGLWCGGQNIRQTDTKTRQSSLA